MARFPQLDRLKEYDEWRDWKREPDRFGRRNHRRVRHDTPLDEILTTDGVVGPREENE